MAKRVAEAPHVRGDLFIDTNILLTASAPQREHHRTVLEHVLSELPAQGLRLVVSQQILREYLVVATRPLAVNGLGLDVKHAIANIGQFRKRLSMIGDGDDPTNRLIELVQHIPCIGKQIHDAAIVATMLANNIGRIVTLDAAYYLRFSPLIKAVPPHLA
jgi:predicted nucleic acid-binding protein